MAATTMDEISLLVKNLKNNPERIKLLPHLTFQSGEVFQWSHTACAITYNPVTPNAAYFLLHEYGHALLQHQSYQHDIDLLKMERAAWEEAQSIAPEYHFLISDNFVEDSLDTYRDWLHARSQCPQCEAVGLQISAHHYTCLACQATWRVNAATSCALRRHITKRRRL